MPLVLRLSLYSRCKTAPHVLLVQSGRSNSVGDSGRISVVVVVVEGGGGLSNCRALLLSYHASGALSFASLMSQRDRKTDRDSETGKVLVVVVVVGGGAQQNQQ